jgi:TonB-dependent receptor
VPELELHLDTVVTREERHEDKSRIQVEFNRGTLLNGTVDPATNTLTRGEFNRQRVDYNDFTRDTNVETTGMTAGAIWDNKTWHLAAKFSSSFSEEDFDEYQAQARINADGVGGYDLGDDPRTPRLYTASLSLPLSSIVLRGLNDNKRIISIGEDELQLDAKRAMEAGFITSYRAGYRGAETKFKRRQGGPPSAPLTAGGRALTFANGVTPFILDGSFGLGRGGGDFLTKWPEVDAKEMFFRYAPPGPVVFDDNNIYTVREKNQAAYVMADFRQMFGDAIARGNLGVRMVETNYDGSGRVVVTTPAGSVALDDRPALDADYTKALPSFNFTVQPHEGSKLQVRGAITRAMTRPTVTQISPTVEVDTVNRVISRGRPGLAPFLAWQYDLGVEMYFGKTNEGLISLAGFDKDVDNFIVPASLTENLAFPDQGVAAQNYIVSTYRNGGKAAVRGFEFSVQSPFSFLPGWLGHFGGAINYTFTDSKFTDENGHSFTFPGASENTYNLVLYYEQKGFSTRLAYNYRDDYLIAPSGFADGSNALYGEGQGRLDLSVRYRFKSGLRLSFDALNLTREQSYKFYDTPQRYQNFEFEGRILSFGIGYTF